MPSVGAVTSNLNITSQTVNYAAKANDFVLADATTAAVTVTLPAGPVVNTIVAVKKVDTTTSAVSVVPTSPAKIDGDTAVVLAAQGSAVSAQYDGANWQLVSTGVVNATALTAVASSTDTMLAPVYQSGYWYDRRAGSTIGYNSPSSFTPSANTLYYVPCYMHRSVALDRLALGNQTAATGGASIRIGLYNVTSAGAPGALLYDFGLLSPSTSGATVTTVTAAGTLPKGFSYWALSFNGISAGAILAIGQPMATPVQGVPDAQFNYTSASNFLLPLYTQTGIVGASALNGTATGTAIYNPASGFLPTVFWRAA